MPLDPRTRGSLPPDPAIKGSDFSSAMNNVFVALVDLSRRISGLEGERTVINNQSITTGMVQTGAITTSTIAAGSITAAQIQVGNVVASIMTVGAVNASHIDAASVRASVLDATVLTATNAYITSLRASILDAGVLTAASAQIGTLRTSILNSTQIVAQGLQTQVLSAVNAAITSLASFNVTSGTITADLIRTAATGARVEIGNTAGGIKGYNSSGVMTFGFDTTTGTATVGAIAVTGTGTTVPASTLTGFVGGGNLLLDSSFESTDPALPASKFVNAGASFAKSSAQAFHSSTSLAVSYASAGSYCYTAAAGHHGIPITSLRGRPVVFSAWVYRTGTGTLATDMSLRISDDFGTNASALMSTIPANQWTRVVIKGTPSASTTEFYMSLYNPHSAGGVTVYYDGIQLELGDAVTAYSPKADEIIYGSITAVALAANSVTASTIAAGAIDGKTITGALFQTSSSTAKVAFDSSGFYVQDLGGIKPVKITTNGVTIVPVPTNPGSLFADLSKEITFDSGTIKVGEILGYLDDSGLSPFLSGLYMRASGATTRRAKATVSAQIDPSTSLTPTAYIEASAHPSTDGSTNVFAYATKASGATSAVKIIDANGVSSFALESQRIRDEASRVAPNPRTDAVTPATGFGTHYVNYTSSFRYWKDVFGYVHIVGEINDDGTGLASLAGNTVVWSAFPVGYRPTSRCYFNAETNGASPNHFLINTSGELRISDNVANNPSRYTNFGHFMFPTF